MEADIGEPYLLSGNEKAVNPTVSGSIFITVLNFIIMSEVVDSVATTTRVDDKEYG